MNQAPCGFVSFTDDGTMREVNTTLADILGYTRLELEGWHLQKILPPGARVFYHTHVFPILKMHGVAEEVYVALRTKDGRDVPMLMNGVRRERDGAFVSDCVFVKMIQRHAFEEQLLEARRLAERADAAKAKFLSMMSHDLRTPLTAISGHAALLAMGVHGELTEEQRQDVQYIKEASLEVARMMDDILSFAQLESGRVHIRPQTVPLAAAVARAAGLIRLSLQDAGLSFDVGTCDEGAAVTADPDKLQQILLNLLTNAIKFTPPGGRISVVCEQNDERMRIRVRDSGVGIPPDQLERVFEPFVQLDAAPGHRGVGLGLAISRELARAMRGELSADSRPGEGAVFTIELPAAGSIRPFVSS